MSYKEYIVAEDPIGEGLCNNYMTGEEIIRCRDCKIMNEIQPETNQPCSTDPDGFCKWAERKERDV